MSDRKLGATPDHLVIVCCHGIWTPGHQHAVDSTATVDFSAIREPADALQEDDWLIEPFQAGETPTFIEHIKAGVRALGTDGRALLAFSGGMTRKNVKVSEARSYYNLAIALQRLELLGPSSPSIKDNPRILLDELALDSYYNILFSLIEFWRSTATWPSQLTIVSHAFKRHRIVEGHCASIGFPLEKITFIGVNPPDLPMSFQSSGGQPTVTSPASTKAEEMKGVRAAEEQWAADPRGVGPLLAGKRSRRNPWNSSQELFRSEEERRRSGVDTELVNGTESLVEGGRRPWALASSQNDLTNA